MPIAAATFEVPPPSTMHDRELSRLRVMPSDVILGVSTAFGGMLVAALYSISGIWQFDPPMWQVILASGLLALPLVFRRRWPIAIAFLQAAIYIVSGELGTVELTVSQIVLFLGMYSIGAWEPNRQRAFRARLVIVLGMGAWLASAFIRALFDPETAERGVAAFIALASYQLLINAAFFGAAWNFGERAWRQAIGRDELVRANAAIVAQQQQLASQAVSLERVRIARELHDVVAHHVASIGVQAAAARRTLERAPDKATLALRTIEGSSRDAIGELHAMVFALRGDGEHDAHPMPSISELPALIGAARERGMSVEFETIGEPMPLTPVIELTIYRVTQEALTNAQRYAGEAPVIVRLRFEQLPPRVEIEVSDRGKGGQQSSKGTGLGIVGMRERVAAVGGTLQIGPKSRGGWLVRASIPLEGVAIEEAATALSGDDTTLRTLESEGKESR